MSVFIIIITLSSQKSIEIENQVTTRNLFCCACNRMIRQQRNSTNLFDIIWLKSALTGWWESSLYKQKTYQVSQWEFLDKTWLCLILWNLSGPPFFLYLTRKVFSFYLSECNISQVINQKSKSVLWNLTRNVHMKMSLSNHNFVATSSQVQLIVTPQNS